MTLSTCPHTHLEYYTYQPGKGYHHCQWKVISSDGKGMCVPESSCLPAKSSDVELKVCEINQQFADTQYGEMTKSISTLEGKVDQLEAENDRLKLQLQRASQNVHDLNFRMV